MAHELKKDLEHVLAHTGPIWERVAGTGILLTGGTGFVGSWLLESFGWANRHLSLNARIYVLTRNAEAFRSNKAHLAQDASVTILQGDLRTYRFPPQSFHYVIHAAAEVESTQRVLEMAKTHGARRLLYTSSGAVYGEQPVYLEKVEEDSAPLPEPAKPYARAKRESEALCWQAAASGLDVVIARLFAFAGPYLPLDRNFAVGNFVRDARMGGPIRIEGDGTPIRSYLYAADLAIWLWTLLVQGNSAQPYNVGSDRAISILDLAKTVERACRPGCGITIAKTARQGDKPARYLPSTERARMQLGLCEWIGLEEGIRRMFNFP
jgi:nucleoside-diphosphate-sugar epimerase